MSYDHYPEGTYSAAGAVSSADAARKFMSGVYNWMAGGLAITGLLAWMVAGEMVSNPHSVFRNQAVWVVAIVLEFVVVAGLTFAIRKISPFAAGAAFLFYAMLNGVTLAPVFLVYTGSSIGVAFFTTAGTFGATSLYGYMTKRNLSSVGSFCFMGLIGIIIASLVNLFFRSPAVSYIISFIGVFIFIGLTAWDTQKLVRIAEGTGDEALEHPELKKCAIIGALQLYLDFINLFLYLLRLFGNRKS